MKKCWIILLVLVLLSGCGQPASLETVSDVYEQQVLPREQRVMLQLPPEVYTPTLQTDTGSLYLCDRYSVSLATCRAGDLQQTVQTAAGFLPENLQMQQTMQQQNKRYSFTWTAASEEGVQVGRGCILDDGYYHYVLTAMASEEDMGDLRETWHEIFASFRVTEDREDLSTGS